MKEKRRSAAVIHFVAQCACGAFAPCNGVIRRQGFAELRSLDAIQEVTIVGRRSELGSEVCGHRAPKRRSSTDWIESKPVGRWRVTTDRRIEARSPRSRRREHLGVGSQQSARDVAEETSPTARRGEDPWNADFRPRRVILDEHGRTIRGGSLFDDGRAGARRVGEWRFRPGQVQLFLESRAVSRGKSEPFCNGSGSRPRIRVHLECLIDSIPTHRARSH